LKHKICFTREMVTSSSSGGASDPKSILGENKMHLTVIASTAVWVAIAVVLFGAAIVTADTPQQAHAAAASGPIDVMQMMRDAKDLPDERFDAI
jgi:hypothetical protein